MTLGIRATDASGIHVFGAMFVLDGYDQNALAVYFNQVPVMSGGGGGGRGGRQGGGGGRGGFGCGDASAAPRALLSFPTNPTDLLLSGILVGGEALAGRAVGTGSGL